ncbi:MAG: OmpA family protein [Alphaproteobacteria bacterium]|nr:OmpA family protein [Alphaproteobacteria bacterium]
MNAILRLLTGSLMVLPIAYAHPAAAQQSGQAAQSAPIVLAQKALTPEQIAKRKAAKAKRNANPNAQGNNPKARANKKGNNPKARANKKGNNPTARANKKGNNPNANPNARKTGPKKPGPNSPAARNAAQQKKIQQLKANQNKKQRSQRAINEQKARQLKQNRNLDAEQKVFNQQAPSAARQKQLQNLDALKKRRQQQQNQLKAQDRKLDRRDEALDQRAKQLNRRDQNLDARKRQVNQQAKARRTVQTRQVQRNQAALQRAKQRQNTLAKQINTNRNQTTRLKRRNNRLERQRNWLQAQRSNDRRTFRSNFAWRERARIVDSRRDRTIFTALAGAAVGAAIVGTYYVYHNDSDRIYGWRARDAYIDDLDNGWTRNVVIRADGIRVVTIRDVDGFIVRRYRVYSGNRVVMLYDNRPRWWDEGDLAVEVAPVRYSGPRSSYIIEPAEASIDDVYDAVVADPVEEIDRTYTLNQILVNRNLRDYMPRIDLDTINFATGSAEIPDSELDRLDAVGAAMEAAIKENPDEVYLIEGYTDATGDDEENLILSDERATAVANALTQYYDIPPENLVTQGYGEQFLKVETSGPDQRNRRVAIRRITPLLASESGDIALDSEGNEIFEKQ